ncbi:hypothetical protein ZEAMMB73_Zm00001d046628 [Zea mays]|nr:hypothetical protein ZEAMMB73_Zm00001d046628 [Zea mays]
MAHLFC